MNKKLIALAVAGVISGYGAAANAAADVSGYAVVDYTLTDDSGAATAPATSNSKEGKFGAKGEVDFVASPADGVTVRIDVDLSQDTGGGHAGAEIEQAMFAWSATEGVTVLGGIFNNPIGYEAEDKPDMAFNNHGAVYTALDSQTTLDGDNVAGIAVAGAVGPATVTFGFLNDLNQVNEENSIALLVNYSPMAGLDLEVGLATQTGNAGLGDGTEGAKNYSVGDVTNFNVVYTGVQNLEVGIDYLMTDEVIDSAYDLWAGYYVGSGFSVNARISEVEYSAGDITTLGGAAAVAAVLEAEDLPGGDSETTAFNVTYKVASNLKAVLEVASTDITVGNAASTSSDLTTLKFVATF